MTVGIIARAQDGIVFATDSAVTMAESRVTLPSIKGFQMEYGYALWAGDVHKVRAVEGAVLSGVDIHDAVSVLEWKDEEEAEFLVYDRHDGLYMLDSQLATVPCEDWGTIGHGGEAARMLMEALYKKRSCHYVETTLKTVIQIIQKYDTSVYGPARTFVLEAEQ